MDVNWNSVGLKFLIESVELVFKDRFWNYATEAPHEVLQDRVLSARELDISVIHAYVSPDGVQSNVACPQIEPESPTGSPQQGLGSCNELSDCEWFDEIVVGPAVEAGNAVIHRIASGQNENGNGVSASPEFGQKLETIAVGQATV
jgi:hypothetical protein